MTTTVQSWWRKKIAFLLTWVAPFSGGFGADKPPTDSPDTAWSGLLGFLLVLSGVGNDSLQAKLSSTAKEVFSDPFKKAFFFWPVYV